MLLQKQKQQGFTIVELLIVIVVIAILAAITPVAFNGVRQQAVTAGLQADIRNATGALEAYKVLNNEQYPALLSDAGINDDEDGVTFEYTVDNNATPPTFCLTGVSGTTALFSEEDGVISEGVCDGHDDPADTGPSYTYENLDWQEIALPSGMGSAFGCENIATSADGSVVYCAERGSASNGSIFRSTDFGATWTALSAAGQRFWQKIATSDNGQTILAAAQSGYAHVSTDGGVSWTELTNLPTATSWALSVSADGQMLAAGYEIGHIYISTDSGATWENSTSAFDTRRWSNIKISDDKQTLHAATRCTSNSGFAQSFDGAAAWEFRTTSPVCASDIAVSADGQQLYVTEPNTGTTMRYSDDAGASWSDWLQVVGSGTTPPRHVEMSDDGRVVLVLRGGSSSVSRTAYISKDFGATVQGYSTSTGENDVTDVPNDLAVSSDGGVIYVGNRNAIFRGQFD